MTAFKKQNVQIVLAGDSALVLKFGESINVKTNRHIRLFVERLELENKKGIFFGLLEWVPTFCSVSIYYDPIQISRKKLSSKLYQIEASILSTDNEGLTDQEAKTVHTVPVCYEKEFAPDMQAVCNHSRLTEAQVISQHSSKDYLVYMLGFLPGFVYLGGMDKQLETPRLKSPRLKIEAGSVGIAGNQTGVYPLESPGGWQLIGRTPIKPYDPLREPPVLFKAGDYIRFKPITAQEFEHIATETNKKQTSEQSVLSKNVAFSIISAGALTTVQDAGRFGFQKDGFTPSGVMDLLSYQLANAIAGNTTNTAVLETTMLGPKIRFLQDTYFAITGADQEPLLNGQKIPLYTQVFAQAGNELSLRLSRTGLRSYIAFLGGVDVPVILGSRSTSMRYTLGGFKGRALKSGDAFSLCSLTQFCHTRPVPVPEALLTVPQKLLKEKTDTPVIIRVIAGPQDSFFTADVIKKFTKNEYVVSGESDRMGLRLTGPKLISPNGTDIISDGITYGSVQISSSGQPIIMAADHQTCGGYAKIATVISADLSMIGQLTPGSHIRFKFVSYAKAIKVLKKQKKLLSKYIKNVQTENQK
jgi:KipI family sensor histidine kinase inhibitor